jgi:hypothetical protein
MSDMTDRLSEWAYGEHSVSAPFAAVVSGALEVEGVKRTMIGGIMLADFGKEYWQRWRGTMILIPRMIDKTRKPCGMRIDQMMTDPLAREIAELKKVPRDSFWVPEWRAVSAGKRE